MARTKFSYCEVTNEEMDMLTKLFAEPLRSQQFVSFLEKVKRSNEQLHSKTAQMYLMSDAPEQRAMALSYKGRVEFVSELIQLVKQVNK